MVIDADDKETSFWCPRAMLRVGNKKQFSESIATKHLKHANSLLKYVDCKIEEYGPYISLFKAIGSKCKDEANNYLQIQRNNEYERRKLYEDRCRLFEIFEERFRYDMSFFVDSPAKAAWDKRGWLSIRDGLHRIYYLNYKGYDFYPVVTSNDDFIICSRYYKNG